MNITIIGCGYVGKALAHFWRATGHHITATTRSPERAAELQAIAHEVVILQGDVAEVLAKALATQHVVVLCVAPDSYLHYESAYLHTAQALAKAVAKLPLLSQILYTSSISVYGERQGQWVDENTPPSPCNPQTKILLDTELIVQKMHTPFRKVCVLRLGEIVGPDRQISSRLRGLHGRLLPGSGKNYTNLIHLRDIIGATDFALRRQLDGVYNVCNDQHLPRNQFYDLICEQHGIPHVIWDPAITSTHAGNKRISSQKIKNAGYMFYLPSIPIAEI